MHDSSFRAVDHDGRTPGDGGCDSSRSDSGVTLHVAERRHESERGKTARASSGGTPEGVRSAGQSIASLSAHVAAAEQLLATRPAVTTADISRAIARSRRVAMAVAAVLGLRRSDEHPDHARTAPVYHARDVDTAIAAERAWVADRARRSPAAQRRPVEPARGPVGGSLEVVPLADVREPGDVFACEAMNARLSARTCIARQRSLRPECHVCRDCPTGRDVARRVRA